MQTLFFGKPFVPPSHKSDTRPPIISKHCRGIEDTDYLCDAIFMLHKSKISSLTTKIFDIVYSITKPDYNVIKILDDEIQMLHSALPDHLRCQIRIESDIAYLRYINFILHHHLLVLILHRPWAARGFRNAKFYPSRVKSEDAAREILHLGLKLERLTSERCPLYEAHLGCVLVHGCIHAFSMILLSLHMDGGMNQGLFDAVLFDSVFPICESLSSAMPSRVRRWLQLLKTIRQRLCEEQVTQSENWFTGIAKVYLISVLSPPRVSV